MRRPKILDHLVFTSSTSNHAANILKNELSLAPRNKKLSEDFEELEEMILASIKEIKRLKVLD